MTEKYIYIYIWSERVAYTNLHLNFSKSLVLISHWSTEINSKVSSSQLDFSIVAWVTQMNVDNIFELFSLLYIWLIVPILYTKDGSKLLLLFWLTEIIRRIKSWQHKDFFSLCGTMKPLMVSILFFLAKW